ncbi:hypothetical protein EYF80_067753 [Liparis tanakae]|uniref:Uncharacterized protein n=1 Tax=Liparis tanakae TaxID=230148 RepID=A0A4Z2E053_9TELE|nr:hypothetical protein EYF80_067753 [Liparis tanakae]
MFFVTLCLIEGANEPRCGRPSDRSSHGSDAGWEGRGGPTLPDCGSFSTISCQGSASG